MKYLFYLLMFGLLFGSCSKTNDSYNEYTNYIPDTTGGETEVPHDWHDDYNYGGVLEYHVYNNELVGTKWLLWKYYDGYAYTSTHDTVEFVTNTTYRVFLSTGSIWSAVRSYSLNTLPLNTNKELSLYFFAPFGGSCYSGQVGHYFVTDGVLNATHFTNLMDDTAPQMKAWFTKVN